MNFTIGLGNARCAPSIQGICGDIQLLDEDTFIRSVFFLSCGNLKDQVASGQEPVIRIKDFDPFNTVTPDS